MVPERFLPPDAANEDDVDDLEAWVRATVQLMPYVDACEEEDFVAQGLLIAYEIWPDSEIGHFQDALALRLLNRLRDYWREQHPEYRRNTRAERAAAAVGDPYTAKVWAATGLAEEHAEESPFHAPDDVEDDVYTRLKVAAFEAASSPESFMRNPELVGMLLGVASHRPLPTAQAMRVFAELEDQRVSVAESNVGIFNVRRDAL